MSESTREFFETLAKVLLRCWVFGFALVLLWFGLFLGNVYYEIHGKIFNLSQHELELMHYGGMGLTKLFVFVFFLFPWLAIKLVLKKEGG